jgi:hypothetical protein
MPGRDMQPRPDFIPAGDEFQESYTRGMSISHDQLREACNLLDRVALHPALNDTLLQQDVLEFLGRSR